MVKYEDKYIVVLANYKVIVDCYIVHYETDIFSLGLKGPKIKTEKKIQVAK